VTAELAPSSDTSPPSAASSIQFFAWVTPQDSTEVRALAQSLLHGVPSGWALTLLGDEDTARLVTDDDIKYRPTPGLDASERTAALNTAILASTSDLVAILPLGTVFSPSAVESIAAYFNEHPEVDVAYADEAREDSTGTVRWLRRPEFSPERLRNQFYFGDLVVYRNALVRQLEGLRHNIPGAELYDLALRAARSGATIGHIPEPLVVVDSSIPAELTAAEREATTVVLADHMSATGGGVVNAVSASGVADTRRPVIGNPLISIVIPTRGLYSPGSDDQHCYVLDAVKGIIEKSTYTNYELVIVIDDVADERVVEELQRLAGDRLKLVWWSEPFNFSSKVNLGALHSVGEFILLLNDDIDVITPDWLEALLALAQIPGAGMSGAMLYYEDDTIQHAGHAYWQNDAAHIAMFVPRGARGPLGGLLVEREVVGVTAACAMMPMAVYNEVGGLSSLLPGAFNDVDLCMKVTWKGYKIYWTPHAELYHFESKTRDAAVHAGEVAVTWGRWGFRMHSPEYWPYPLEMSDEEWEV
jgi:hypothetical protein